jgi:peptidylprolyl isomerase
MKACGVIFVIALTAIFLGCGGGSETATSADAGSGDRTAAETTQAQQEPDYPLPKIPPKRPPLEKLVVRELEVGEGPKARWGDEVIVRYVGVYWKTGKLFSQHWNSTLDFKLDGEAYGPGWQKGFVGMRVGGRRELVIPGALLFGGGTDAAYVVTLDKVKPGATG